MLTKIQSEFLFVGRGDEGFLENYSYELEEDPEGKGGYIFMSLEILNNDAEAEDIGEAIFANLKQKFYEDQNKSVYDRFEEAVKVVNGTLSDFRTGKVTRFIGNLNILIGALVGSELYITAAGDAEAYLIRKRYVSVISEGLTEGKSPDADADFFMNIGSGILEGGDMVLLSSSRLLRYITKNDLAKLFTHSLTASLASLQDALTTEILGRAAVVGVSVSQEQGGGEFDEESGSEKKAMALPGFLQKFAVHRHVKKLFDWGAGALARTRFRSGFAGQQRREISKDKVLIVLILVILLLLGGVVWLRQKGISSQEIAQQEQILNRAQDMINDAATKGQFDRETGAKLLKEAEDEVLKILSTRSARGKASRLMDEIQKQRMLLDNVKTVENPQVLVDLSETKRDVSTLGLAFLKDRLYAFDYNSLFPMILDKLQEPQSITDSESVILGAAFKDEEGLVFLTRAGKIIEYKDGRFQFMDTADKIWKKGVDIKTYNNRLYILDPERNQIWKYRRKRDAYDIGEGANIDGDLRNAAAFAIDSAVYVANKDGSLMVMYGGNQQKIPVSGSPFTPLVSASRVYTDVDLNQLFVLDASQNRVVAFQKDRRQGGSFPNQLIYTAQYSIKGTGQLRDIYVSKDEGKMYLADDKKIYVTTLTQ